MSFEAWRRPGFVEPSGNMELQSARNLLPNVLSAVRLALVPALLALAVAGRDSLWLVLLALALITDMADGFLARRWRVASELGAKLDSWGDLGIYLSLPLCAWLLFPHIVRRELFWVATGITAFVVPVLVGLARFRRFTSYHTWGAKLSAVLMGPSLLLLLADVTAAPFRLVVVLFVLAEIEEVMISFVLPRWRADVPTLVHALRVARAERNLPEEGSLRPDRH